VFSHYFAPLARDKNSDDVFAMPTSLDMSETKNVVNVVLDVPGIDEQNIEISFIDGALDISGHREEEAEEKEADFHRVERSYGAFRRRIALPCEVDADKIKAKLKNGVLKIKLPKSAKAKSNGRKIEISTS
jgi:HSP20 family protein